MRDYISEHSAELLRRQQKRKRWYRLLCVCACIVVFCTTYALILPAITLDQTVSPGGSATISVGDTVTLQGSSGNKNGVVGQSCRLCNDRNQRKQRGGNRDRGRDCDYYASI